MTKEYIWVDKDFLMRANALCFIAGVWIGLYLPKFVGFLVRKFIALKAMEGKDL